MLDLIRLGVAVVLWVVVVARAGCVTRPGAERSLWFVFVMFACALSVQLQGVRQLADTVLAPLGGSAWAWMCFAVLAAAGTRCLFLHTTVTGAVTNRIRGLTALTSTGLAVVTLSFVLQPAAPVLASTADPELLRQAPFYTGDLGAAVRWTVWLTLLTWALAGMAHVTAQYAGHASRTTPGRLTTGLSIGGLGCRIGYGYVVLKAIVVAAWVAGAGPAFLAVDQAADLIALTSIALIITGSTHDAFSARVQAGRRRLEQLRAWWRLRPLWQLLREAAPADAGQLLALGTRARLRRRVLEIRDRQMALRHYAGADCPRAAFQAAQAAGLEGEDARVVAEAAWLETARRAKRRGRQPTVRPPNDPGFEVTGGQSLDEEVRWLLRVADAHATCALVPAFADLYLRQPALSSTGNTQDPPSAPARAA